jgi:hypothetical protein
VLDLVAFTRQGTDQGLADRGIVFDHEEARHGRGS